MLYPLQYFNTKEEYDAPGKWVEYYHDWHEDLGPDYGQVSMNTTQDDLRFIGGMDGMIKLRFVDTPSRAWITEKFKEKANKIHKEMKEIEELTSILNTIEL